MSIKYSGYVNTFMTSNGVILKLDESDRQILRNFLESFNKRAQDVVKITRLLLVAESELKSVESFEADFARLSYKALEII